MVKLSPGGIAFLVGILLVVISGFIVNAMIPVLLVLLALGVAILNVSRKESTNATLLYIGLAIIGLGTTWVTLGNTLATVPQLGSALQTILGNFSVFVMTVALVSLVAMFIRTHKD